MSDGTPSGTFGYLSTKFPAFAFKRLVATEVDPDTSHGHELQGVQNIRQILGDVRREQIPAEFYYLADGQADGPQRQSGSLTWYDSRENDSSRRPEYRLYYPSNVTLIQEFARPGDLAIVALGSDDVVRIFIASAGSTFESQLQWLFGVEAAPIKRFKAIETKEHDQSIGVSNAGILEELGFEPPLPPLAEQNFLPGLLDTFGARFPTTRVFSEYARQSVGAIDVRADPDHAIMRWMEREELLFRTLENYIVGHRIQDRFNSVDDFVGYSLSVHQRRKSRAGMALENHFEALANEHLLQFERGARTEGRSSPDFLFPGSVAYKSESFPVKLLTMLGVKSTCKDRWRQVLAEAIRIENKHLLTLEPGISAAQTQEMASNKLTLVVPKELLSSYQPSQRETIVSVSDIIALVKLRQNEGVHLGNHQHYSRVL